MENKRDTGIYFKLSAKEMELIHQKKALLGVRNTSAYLRKMAIDGYVIQLDMKELTLHPTMLIRWQSELMKQAVSMKPMLPR